jgi:serine/threonine protein kinase/tetratricopeptide (TPR) repeat protein
MNPKAQKVRDLFVAAVKVPPEQWEAFLKETCAGDEELRRQVSDLLQEHQQAGSFLDRPVVARRATGEFHPGPNGAVPESLDPATAKSADPSMTIGPYKLLERIGEGGMGTVWMAEQREPVQRKVALKIIKAGMDGRQVIVRFEAERQALALMDHPNIATVFDGGTATSGRPFFVMELVKGMPITRYCDEHRLTPRERLELFVPVCQAIQHAHTKGIIHRDVKPSNVLVALFDGQPVPKLIDFGLAKATGQRLTERTLFTEFGAVVGTLEYMSPEQAELNNQDIDTRSDIYSLGVLLYELLTGTTPLNHERLKQAAFTDILRMIREEEPPRPSTRLSELGEALPSISARRHTEPARLTKLVRGELDWIVMKALEKDRNRRYESASAFAADVERYLADEPVQACPPSAAYRLKKFLRRNRGPVLVAGAIAVLLVSGIIGTSLGFVRAERLRQVALRKEQDALDEKAKALAAHRRAMEELRATTDHVVEQLIGAKPVLGPAEKAFLETALKRWQTFAAEQGDGELAQQARAEGMLRVAQLRGQLGERDAAISGYREATALLDKLAAEFPAVPEYRRQLAASHTNVGNLLDELGRRAEAESAYRQALTIQDKLAADFPAVPLYRQKLALTYTNLGLMLRNLGRYAEAEEAYRHALSLQDKLAAEFPAKAEYRLDLARNHGGLGVLLVAQSRHAEAEAAHRQALSLLDKLAADFPALPEYRLDLAMSHSGLGMLLAELGRLAGAETALRQALTIRSKLAADFPAMPGYRLQLAKSHNNLGILLRNLGRYAEAEAAYREALRLLDRLTADFPPVPEYQQSLATSYHNLANLLRDLGRRTEAEAAYRRALARQNKLAADFPAVPRYRQELASIHNNLGILLTQAGQSAAEQQYRQALELRQKLVEDFPTVPEYAVDLAGTWCNLGHLRRAQGRPASALDWHARAIRTLTGLLEKDARLATARRFLGNAHLGRAMALMELARHKEALADWDRAIELVAEPARDFCRFQRIRTLVHLGEHQPAAAAVKELARRKDPSPVDLYQFAGGYALCSSAARLDQKLLPAAREKLAEEYAHDALRLLRDAIAKGYQDVEQLKQDPDFDALRAREEFQALARELEAQAKPGINKP